MLINIDHIDLLVPDVEATVTFLKSLGLVEKRRSAPPRCSVEMQIPGEQQVVIELRPGCECKTTLNHIAFKIDCENTIECLEYSGIKFGKKHSLIKDTGRTVSNVQDYSGQSWQLTD